LNRTPIVVAVLLALGSGLARAQDQVLVTALRQQREEALDKVAQAYMTIIKLQRELDRMKADEAKRVQGLATPSAK